MLRLITIASLVALAGCGSQVDHDSAVKVASSALTGTVAADGQVVHVDWSGSAGHVDVALTNPAGMGSAQVTGIVTKSGSSTTETIDVDFSDWTDPLEHVTLNGTLHEAGTFSAPLPLTGDATITGALSSSGSVNATVDFDVHGTYAPSGFAVTGDVGGNSIDVQVGAP
ncbi:MAG TPA: hypothetical protein VF334_17030 [Polyangia bacterium]